MTTVEVWERDQVTPGVPVKVCDLSEVPARKFGVTANDYGTAQVTVQSSDPEIGEIQPGRLLVFDRAGTRYAFVIGPRKIVEVSDAEEAGQVVQLTIPGTLAVLNDARVQPYGGAGWSPSPAARRWDWTNPLLDTTAWTAAVELWRQGDPADFSASTFIEIVRDQGRHGEAIPEEFTEADAMWIWSSTWSGSPGTGGSGTRYMEPGVSYFHKTFTTTEDKYVRVVAACDDFVEVAVDGEVLIATGPAPQEAWSRARTKDLFVTAGTHTIRARCENFPRSFTYGNIAAFVCAVHEVSASDGTIVSTITHTDDTWKALDYPTNPPGFTVDDIVDHLVAEAQAEGFVTDVTVNPSGTWTEASDVVTAVGDKLGEVLRQLAEHHVDFRVNADLSVDLWPSGAAGSASGVTLEVGVNITGLEFDGDTTPVSSLLVRHQEGFIILGDDSTGRQEYLDLSSYPVGEATELGQAELDEMSSDRWAATMTIEPDGSDTPFDNFNVFDTVTVPNPAGTTSAVRCIATTWSEDDAGNERLGAEVGDVILTGEERAVRMARIRQLGLLNGRSVLAPLDAGGSGWMPTPISSPIPHAQTFHFPFHRDAAATRTTSDAWPAGAARTIFEFAVSLGAAQGTSTAVLLEVNGVTVATATVAAGATAAVVSGLNVAIVKDSDLLTVTCTATGFSLLAEVRAR